MPFVPAQNFSPDTRVRVIKGPPTLRRVNGIGTFIAGQWQEPSFRDVYFKQLIVTFIFVPIFFGHIYAVVDGKKGGWHFVGRITGHDFRDRFGWRAYLKFKGSIALETLIFGVAIISLLILFSVAAGWLRHQS